MCDSRAQPWTTTSLLLLCLIVEASCSYRQYHMDNADICSSPGKGQVLHLGTGASLFQLEEPSLRIQPNMHHKATLCEVHVKAPKDYGFIVHVEKLRLRVMPGGGGDCVDYIQFGQDDNVPFYTTVQSERLCGDVPGFVYNDPKGDLLIWISLGGRRGASLWPDISVVNLTLIVTAYQVTCSEPSPNQVKCRDGKDICIWNKYVCDHHFNCPGASDEEGCTYDRLHRVTSILSSEKGKGRHLEILSFILFILAFGLISCFVAIVFMRHRRKCCFKSSSSSGSCDLPEQTVFSLRELSNTERQTLENVYLPLNSLVQRPPPPSLPEDGPPPAYDDLFPGEEASGNTGVP